MKNVQTNYKVWFGLAIVNIIIFIKNFVEIIVNGLNVLNLVVIVASLFASILLLIRILNIKKEKV